MINNTSSHTTRDRNTDYRARKEKRGRLSKTFEGFATHCQVCCPSFLSHPPVSLADVASADRSDVTPIGHHRPGCNVVSDTRLLCLERRDGKERKKGRRRRRQQTGLHKLAKVHLGDAGHHKRDAIIDLSLLDDGLHHALDLVLLHHRASKVRVSLLLAWRQRLKEHRVPFALVRYCWSAQKERDQDKGEGEEDEGGGVMFTCLKHLSLQGSLARSALSLLLLLARRDRAPLADEKKKKRRRTTSMP